MSVSMPVPTKITQDSGRTIFQRVHRSEFGHGYAQTAGQGINSIREVWNITWVGLTAAERNTVAAALRSAATDTLLWTPTTFGETTERKFQIVVEGYGELYTETQTAGQYYNISTQLQQVF